MQLLTDRCSKGRLVALSSFTVAALVCALGAQAQGVVQSGEQGNMRLVGHYDAQGRGLYQPNVIAYPDGQRMMAFLGTHAANLPNPLNGGIVEPNGTLIVDITDPANPVPQFHIPGTGADSQMVRMCLGSQLPGGTPGKVYLLRNFNTGYETWDVTDPSAPRKLATLSNIRSTHKLWWECNTGIAYMPGSKDATYGQPLWRQSQSMVIVDWSNPNAPPKYIRTFGLTGTQPTGTGPVPTSLHGAISAHEHPDAALKLASGVTADDVIGNRIYAAWGVGSDGVVQILDRKQLLPPAYGGVYAGPADSPTDADLLSAQVGVIWLSPDQGGHTSMPVFGLEPKSLQDVGTQKRDILLIASEAGGCGSHHWSFVADITTENSFGVRPNPWQGPMILSTLRVDPSRGEKFVRGNYCDRGQRFGVHSSEENFRNPFYGRLTFTSYFNAGVRAWDIRDPQAPVEVGFYVPAAVNNTYMTNNVEVDNRGYILIVDRIGMGFDILELTGNARRIGFDK